MFAPTVCSWSISNKNHETSESRWGYVMSNPPGKVSQVPEFDEKEVLARASQGDREAFGELYEQYVERIFQLRLLSYRQRP